MHRKGLSNTLISSLVKAIGSQLIMILELLVCLNQFNYFHRTTLALKQNAMFEAVDRKRSCSNYAQPIAASSVVPRLTIFNILRIFATLQFSLPSHVNLKRLLEAELWKSKTHHKLFSCELEIRVSKVPSLCSFMVFIF